MIKDPEPRERVSDFVSEVARHSPDAEAAVVGDMRLTYAQLSQRIDELARALLAAGVRRGDRVATLQTPHPDYLTAFLATASIGAIWIGLNPRYRLDELRYVIGDAEPKVLLSRTRIGARDYASDLAELKVACPSLETIVALDGEAGPDAVAGYEAFIAAGALIQDAELDAARAATGGLDPCMIVYTSGSTGRPKGALLHHKGVRAFSQAQNRLWPVSPQRMLNYFPINHIGCVLDLSCPTLAAGGTLVFLEQFDPETAMRMMVEERCTIWGSVPNVLQLQLALPDFERFDLSAVQLILWEGAAMPEETVRRLLQVGAPLATNYGMTETGSAIAATAPTRDIDVLTRSVGFAFEGVEVRLVKPNGEEASDGEDGEVLARSIYNMAGYWRRPDATAETLTPDGWVKTGDTAVKRPDGRYRIVGRIKEMYKSGGYNVYPREVEDVIEAHPAVIQAAVVGISDPQWGESGVAYVVPSEPLGRAALETFCRERLANYKVPKRFVFQDELPLLPIGKVDKVALRKSAQARLEAEHDA